MHHTSSFPRRRMLPLLAVVLLAGWSGADERVAPVSTPNTGLVLDFASTVAWQANGDGTKIAAAPGGPAGLKSYAAFTGRAPGVFGGTRRPQRVDGVPAGPAHLELLLPGDAPEDLQVTLFLKDKDGLWFQCTARGPWVRGAWTKAEFDLRPGAGCVQPEGHGAAWNNYYARHMSRVGISFFSASKWSGTAGVGRLWIDRPADGELRLYGAAWVSPAPAKAYERQELAFQIEGFSGNPFDPDQITADAVITQPDGVVFRRPAFYYQGYRRALSPDGKEVMTPEGAASWRMRLTPQLAGTWRWHLAVTAGDRAVRSAEHILTVAPGAARGFVRVSPQDPRFFETADGAFFYPIGEHIHTPYDVRSVNTLHMPLSEDHGTFTFDYYHKKLQAAGANANMLWMSSWWLAIEWTAKWPGYFGLDDYNLGNAWRLDYVMNSAADHGIHNLLVIDNHGKIGFADSEWETNPLNVSQGGPCDSPNEFFTTEVAFNHYRRRIRYIAARWGEDPNLMGWELVSEQDLTGNNFRWHPDTVKWYARASRYLEEVDRLKRPVTVQYCRNWRNIDPAMSKNPCIEFLTANAYTQPGEARMLAPLFQETYRVMSWYKKAIFIAECGGDSGGSPHPQLRSDFHCGLWICGMLPYAGTPFFWWYEFADRQNLYPHLRGFSKFMAGDDLRGVEWKYGEWPVEGEKGGVRAFGMKGPERGRAWVFDDAILESLEAAAKTRHAGFLLPVSELRPGQYEVELWDTVTGEILRSDQIACGANGRLRIDLPEFAGDCAVKFRRTGD